MSYGERLSQWSSLIESPKYRARRDIWDPVKWKWDIGMLAGEMGMPNKLKDILNSIQRTNFLLSTTNVNSKLALENLMLEL